jgi:hypothetical protein
MRLANNDARDYAIIGDLGRAAAGRAGSGRITRPLAR